MTIILVATLVFVHSLVTCQSFQDTNEKISKVDCNIEEQFVSAYVVPMVELPTEIVGCHSSETSSAQEIHVLSLIKPSIDADIHNGHLPKVTLVVRPKWKEKVVSNVIVILLSVSPVMWQLNLQDMGNVTQFHIIVDKPSYAVVPSISASTSRRKLPPLKKLPTWIHSHHGPVTSFSLVPLANEITLSIGVDSPLSTLSCNFSSHAQSVNVKANYVQSQPASGCSAQSLDENHQNLLYLLELKSGMSAANNDVLISMKHSQIAGFSQKILTKQNITLILKSHTPVEWIIESENIGGFLDIITDHPVHLQLNPLYISTVVHDKVLPDSSQTLVASVQKSFGPINAYVKTAKANHINIIIRGKIGNVSKLQQSEDVSVRETAPSSEVAYDVVRKTETIADLLPANSKSVISTHSLSEWLAKQMVLTCTGDKMTVYFPLEETMTLFSEAIGSHIKLTFITLADSNCKAEQNETHVVLESEYNSCGSKVVTNDVIEYHNQVQFITANYVSSKETSSEEKHLPTDDDDYVSEDGSGSDDLLSVDLKNSEERTIYPTPFLCTQPITAPVINVSAIKYELNLYEKKDFLRPLLQSSPFNIVAHDFLFVEAIIKADNRLCIVVDECWLSEDGMESKIRKNILIKQGCPTDLSVDILTKSHCGHNSDVDHYKMRFSFQLSEEFVNQHLYLHCQLTSCAMQDSKQLKIKQCIRSEDFCLKQSLRPYLDSLRGKKYSVLARGPIHVIAKNKPNKDKNLFSLIPDMSIFNPSEPSSTPENLIVDYSFDKLTGSSKKNAVSQPLIIVGLSTEAVIGIAFASFFIGAGLMATLWLIHTYTKPSRRTRENRRHSSRGQYHHANQLSFDSFDKTRATSLKPMSVQLPP